jgi:hypothetical protein
MKWNITNRHTFLNFISLFIVLAGLGSAIWIYQTAGNDSNGVIGYEEEDGAVYPVVPEDSKKFLRDLELYGGKTGVLLYEFRSWFVGLWHGKSLAYTVACIAILISLGFYVVNYLQSGLESDIRNKMNRKRSDENIT